MRSRSERGGDGSRPRGTARSGEAIADARALSEQLEDWLAARASAVEERFVEPFDRAAFIRETGFVARGRGQAEACVGRDVGLELGHPATTSLCCTLAVADPARVIPGRLRWLGPDLPDLERGRRHPLAQIALLRLHPGAAFDPFALDIAQYLLHRLPGYVVRSMPGRLWVRVSIQALARRLGFETVARALCCALVDDCDAVAAAELLFVSSSVREVDSLRSWVAQAQRLGDQQRKRYLVAQGDLDCGDLDCATCDDRDTCDALREVIRSRRQALPSAAGGPR